MQKNIAEELYSRQLEQSDTFRSAFSSLYQSSTREVQYHGFSYTLQLNPARIKSSTADISKPLGQQSCFLCRCNMPEYQIKAECDSEFFISVNPYPILPRHLTIISHKHTPQTIHGHIASMLKLAADMPGMCVFYNSPKSGASAPFHCHLQAGLASELPAFRQIDSIRSRYAEKQAGGISLICGPTRRMAIIESPSISEAESQATNILRQLGAISGNHEPEANIGAAFWGGLFRAIIFPRQLHRPWQYFADDPQKILISPGFADMAGLIPCSRPCDYDRITHCDITSIMNQASISAENLLRIEI